jgi:hypothetical protein
MNRFAQVAFAVVFTSACHRRVEAKSVTTESAALQVGDASLPRGAGWDAVLLHFVR